MKLEIEIQDGRLQNLSQDAHLEVLSISKKYIEDILDEANRIEASRRISVQNPEITASIISDAAYFSRNFGIRKKKKKRKILLPIVAFLASNITGWLFDIDKFTTISYILLFLLVFSASIVSTIFIILNDNENE